MWIGFGKGKGGAGCTTTALEIAYAAARRRRRQPGRHGRIAYIDLDPAAHATHVLEPDDTALGIKDVLNPRAPRPLAEALTPTAWDGILLAPAGRLLANREADITPETIDALRRSRNSGELDGIVDDVIIDLPGDLGKLATAGLLGMRHLFIVARASLWSAQGAEEMRYTAERIQKKANPELEIPGIIITEFDRSRDSQRILASMQTDPTIGPLVILPPIPRKVEVRESIESYHTPCRDFGDPGLVEVADVYQNIFDRFLALQEKTES